MWDKIKAFLASLGHNLLSEIMAALPEAKQIALQAITVLIDAAVAYVEAKYAPQMASLKALEPLSAEAKLDLNNQRRNDALNYIKEEMAKDPSKYTSLTDSLIYFGIEVGVQKSKTLAEGNHGNFPGGDSGPVV